VALTEREKAIRRHLKADLEHYAARCLKIRTKAGTIEPLLFNRMQRYLHVNLEEHAQRNRGRVRVIILKARQQGCSTYIGARFYHKATHVRGQQVFILTHEQAATDNLFDMANRFHEYCPGLMRPHTGVGERQGTELRPSRQRLHRRHGGDASDRPLPHIAAIPWVGAGVLAKRGGSL
jgi:hypothetical protein